jgi:predicted peptidase
MRQITNLLIILTFLGCKNYTEKKTHIDTELYELIVPKKHNELLILFPGFGGTNKSIKTECSIVQKALKENISILILKNNQNFFLDNKELEKLRKVVIELIEENNINSKSIYIGGFSAGGNLGLQLGKCLIKKKKYENNIKGIFIIDSPVDLEQLYFNYQNKLAEDESGDIKYFLNFMERQIGNPENNMEKYKEYSPYLSSIKYTKNVEFKNTELIFYTEPAIKYRKDNFNQNFEDTNGFQIKKLSKLLNKRGHKSKYIETENKGYRKNGMRNPHSWSIMDENEIIEWIKKTMSNNMYN